MLVEGTQPLEVKVNNTLLLYCSGISFGPGIESRWGQDFPHPSGPALHLIHPPVQGVPGFFPGEGGGKATGT